MILTTLIVSPCSSVFCFQVTVNTNNKARGLMSEILYCVVSFVNSASESDVYTTVLKIPSISSLKEAQENLTMKFDLDDKFINDVVKMHNSEVGFYNDLVSTFDIPHIKVFKALPWVVGEAEGVLHMEDMTGKGELWELAHTFNLSQIREITRYLVHVHTMCLTSDENHQQLWKERFSKDQCVMNKFTKMNEDYEPFLKICGDKGLLIK